MCRGKQFGMFPPCSCIFRSFVLSSHATVTVVGAVSISFFPAGELNALVHSRPLPLSTPLSVRVQISAPAPHPSTHHCTERGLRHGNTPCLASTLLRNLRTLYGIIMQQPLCLLQPTLTLDGAFKKVLSCRRRRLSKVRALNFCLETAFCGNESHVLNIFRFQQCPVRVLAGLNSAPKSEKTNALGGTDHLLYSQILSGRFFWTLSFRGI